MPLSRCRILLFTLAVVFSSAVSSRADQTAVRIEAPAAVAAGSEITITVHVTHEGNNFFHFTDWVWLKAGDHEIGRWDFTAQQRPEDENFTRQVRHVITGPTVLTAQGHCNIHGSAGPARATVQVGGTPARPTVTAAPPSPGPGGRRRLLGWIVLGLGIANLLLCGFQVATGRRWIKVKITAHRRSGQLLLALALIHGALAILINL